MKHYHVILTNIYIYIYICKYILLMFIYITRSLLRKNFCDTLVNTLLER